MKLLIVKSSAIGDVLQTFGVLDYLKRHYPEAQVDWVVEAGIAPLLRAHPLVSRVIEIDTKRWRKRPSLKQVRQAVHELRDVEYDVLFDLQGNIKSALITALARAHVKIGYTREGVQEWCNLLVTNCKVAPSDKASVRAKYLHLVQSYFGDQEPFESQGVELGLTETERQNLAAIDVPKPCWMICCGSNWKNKQMPEEKWLLFLQKQSVHFLFVHGSDEEHLFAKRLASHFPERSTVCPRMSLPLWQHVMARCDLVVSVDSAALHLAATTSTPTLGIFGSSSAIYYKPEGKHHLAVQGPCPYGQQFRTRCPQLRTCPTGECMNLVELESSV